MAEVSTRKRLDRAIGSDVRCTGCDLCRKSLTCPEWR